jgi:hypothetical protein
MILIDHLIVDDIQFYFYDGIDFNEVINHPNDGSGGFKFFFIDNWVAEMKYWKRECQISKVLTGEIKENNPIEIENNWVSIYQLEGTDKSVLLKVIKDKVLNKCFIGHPWIPISGLNKGAWKIGKIRDFN